MTLSGTQKGLYNIGSLLMAAKAVTSRVSLTFSRKYMIFLNLSAHGSHVKQLGILLTAAMWNHCKRVPEYIAEIGMHPTVMD